MILVLEGQREVDPGSEQHCLDDLARHVGCEDHDQPIFTKHYTFLNSRNNVSIARVVACFPQASRSWPAATAVKTPCICAPLYDLPKQCSPMILAIDFPSICVKSQISKKLCGLGVEFEFFLGQLKMPKSRTVLGLYQASFTRLSETQNCFIGSFKVWSSNYTMLTLFQNQGGKYR